jgi:hypothetical protein
VALTYESRLLVETIKIGVIVVTEEDEEEDVDYADEELEDVDPAADDEDEEVDELDPGVKARSVIAIGR